MSDLFPWASTTPPLSKSHTILTLPRQETYAKRNRRFKRKATGKWIQALLVVFQLKQLCFLVFCLKTSRKPETKCAWKQGAEKGWTEGRQNNRTLEKLHCEELHNLKSKAIPVTGGGGL
jgi:hypothetical protein